MLAAAGLGVTWVFKKAQVLAIFDDLFTILLLIPLKIMFVGMKPELFVVMAIMFLLLFVAEICSDAFYSIPMMSPSTALSA
jgi:hypothetical protein